MHTTTLGAVGGSVSVSLARQILRMLGVAADASVAVPLENGRPALSPARPRHTLGELLATPAAWTDLRRCRCGARVPS